ncbi:MAG: aminoglycoside phosphotransferase family protein [bacterium]|nr:aminoglycoside phosphotransferase family protein [bacterium]
MTGRTPEALLAERLHEVGEHGAMQLMLLRAAPSWVVLAFEERTSTPSYVFKASSDPQQLSVLRHEHELLVRLHSSASHEFRRTVPLPLSRGAREGLEGFLVRALPGTRMKDLSPARLFGPGRISATLDAVARWLLDYYATLGLERVELDSDVRDALFEEPAAAYLELFETTASERDTIGRALDRLAHLAPTGFPLCPCHGDFSPANVIRDRRRIGVIDYEFAAERWPPLDDLLHFLAAMRSTSSSEDRDAARRAFFAETFYGRGRVAQAVRRTVAGFAGRLGLEAAWIEPLFVLAWVRLAVRSVRLHASELGLDPVTTPRKELWSALDADGEYLPVTRAHAGRCDNVRQHAEGEADCVFHDREARA